MTLIKKDSKIGKLLNSKIGKIASGLVREGLQTVPVVGTIITNLKTDTPDNPAGKIKLSKWDIYRLVIGLVVGYVLYKGILTIEQVQSILSMIGLS